MPQHAERLEPCSDSETGISAITPTTLLSAACVAIRPFQAGAGFSVRRHGEGWTQPVVLFAKSAALAFRSARETFLEVHLMAA
jgi:hypothetical protein